MEEPTMLDALKVPLAVVAALAGLAQDPIESPKPRAFAYYQEAVNDPNGAKALNEEQQRWWAVPHWGETSSPHPGAFFLGGGYGDSGVTLVPVDDSTRAHLKLPKGQGLIATSVVPRGPAAQAGVSENDVLLSLGDAPLGKPEDLEEQLKAAGDKPIGLVVLHHGEKKTLQVQPQIKVSFGPVRPEPPAFWIGVSVTPVEPALRDQLRIPADEGLLATDVVADGPGARAGLKLNDILLTMDGKPLKDQPTLVDLVQKNGEKSVAVEILREGSRQRIELTPARRKGALRVSRVRHSGDWNINFLRPGFVVQDWSNPGSNKEPIYTYTLQDDSLKVHTNPAGGEPLAKRLDGMSAEIKELRKAIDELRAVLKDRK
jgi:membrane-associated protease RseP (regulator of RpoE activity)